MSSHHSQGWWGNNRERRLAIRRALLPGRRRTWLDRLLRRKRRGFYQ